MQMHDLPAFVRFAQDDSSSVEEAWSIVEVKRRNCYVSEQLYFQISRLNVHVWSGSLRAAYLLENCSESLLEFSVAIGTLWNRVRIEYCGVVIEREPEVFPIEIIKGPDEVSQRLPYIGI